MTVKSNAKIDDQAEYAPFGDVQNLLIPLGSIWTAKCYLANVVDKFEKLALISDSNASFSDLYLQSR